MECISIFEIFKIGVGPSSSHTMGPWKAAEDFVQSLQKEELLSNVAKVEIHLYGSLAKTGVGHATDMAVQAGLSGLKVDQTQSSEISQTISQIASTQTLQLKHIHSIPFQALECIHFHFDQQLPYHPNGMKLIARDAKHILYEAVYYSIGGGFIIKDSQIGESATNSSTQGIRTFLTAQEVLEHCATNQQKIWEAVLKNELQQKSETDVYKDLHKIWRVMLECAHKGCYTEGILPGGLHVNRRAKDLNQKLLNHQNRQDPNVDEWLALIQQSNPNFNQVNKWISCFALAINEENASFGRVVTAPTNGAAGVIPAVLLYYYCFEENVSEKDLYKFLMVAGQIGILFKHKATISAAMGGCQAEIGVSSAMAAAALTECRGGSVAQSLMAAEIAMEHHLGMTCDPVGGLVQIPCIERNTMGAVKAITASNISLESDPSKAKVSLDQVIQTMWETAQDMNAKYKETSEGGLAVQIPVNLPDC